MKNWMEMIMMDNILEKLSLLDNCVINHREYNRAVEGILNCWKETLYSPNKSVNCMLIAEGGLGKTTICNKVLENFTSNKVIYDGYSIVIKPAFYIQIPAKTNIDNLTKLMLQELGDINPSSGTAFDRYARLTQKLKISETKLIIFDEFHHIYSTESSRIKTSKNNENIANWIKTLGDSNKICICLVSLPDYVELFLRDSQQSRRFKDQFYLNPLTIVKDHEKTHIKPFVSQVQEYIRNEIKIQTEDMSRDEYVLRLFIATNGYHDFLMSLIKRALKFKLENQDCALTKAHFKMAWDTHITRSVRLSSENPFEMSEQRLLKYYESAIRY